MTSFFILICLLIGIIITGMWFYLKKDQIKPEEKSDAEYICTLCDDHDCVCHKQDPKSKNQD